MTKKIPPTTDNDLFRQAMGKVCPVNRDKVLLPIRAKPKPYPLPLAASVELAVPDLEIMDLEAVGIEDTLSFLNTGLRHNTLKKLRQGFFGVNAEIDLHGLTAITAKHQLIDFLHACVQKDYRCVRIIHGKGYRSQDNYPILKNNLNLWLRQHQEVLAFCSAAAKDGGTGAVVVLLRSN